MIYFLFFFITYAMASIVVEQKIFFEVRQWLMQCSSNSGNILVNKFCGLIHCIFCTGFWCGGFITWTGLNIFDTGTNWDIFYGALAGALGSYSFYLIYHFIEFKLFQLGVIKEYLED